MSPKKCQSKGINPGPPWNLRHLLRRSPHPRNILLPHMHLLRRSHRPWNLRLPQGASSMLLGSLVFCFLRFHSVSFWHRAYLLARTVVPLFLSPPTETNGIVNCLPRSLLRSTLWTNNPLSFEYVYLIIYLRTAPECSHLSPCVLQYICVILYVMIAPKAAAF